MCRIEGDMIGGKAMVFCLVSLARNLSAEGLGAWGLDPESSPSGPTTTSHEKYQWCRSMWVARIDDSMDGCCSRKYSSAKQELYYIRLAAISF